jgi:hypothetical protein
MSMKSVVTMARAAVLGVAAVAFWGLAPGCGGPSIGAYCDKACECVGCNDKQRDECTDAVGDAKKKAEDDGCSDQFNDYLSCVNEELECKNDQLNADGCESEAKAFGKCSGGSGFGKNGCEKLADKVAALYEKCGVDPGQSQGGDTQCSGAQEAQAQCLSPCVDIIPCVCIDSNQFEQCTSEVAQPYTDCVTACQ